MDQHSIDLLDDLNIGDEIVVERRLQHKVYGFVRGRYDGLEGFSLMVNSDMSYHVIPTKQITKIRLKKAHVSDSWKPPPVD